MTDHKLYYVSYDDEDGNDRDLFVTATSPEAVFDLWGSYYMEFDWIPGAKNLEWHDLTGEVVLLRPGEYVDDLKPFRIMEVPLDVEDQRALPWGAPNGVILVAYMEVR